MSSEPELITGCVLLIETTHEGMVAKSCHIVMDKNPDEAFEEIDAGNDDEHRIVGSVPLNRLDNYRGQAAVLRRFAEASPEGKAAIEELILLMIEDHIDQIIKECH